MSDYTDDPEWQRLVAGVRKDLIPTLEGSDVSLSIVPDGEGDVKFAVELGFTIMMEKPLVLIVRRGQRVPPKLEAVADAIIRLNHDIDTQEGRDEYRVKLKVVLEAL